MLATVLGKSLYEQWKSLLWWALAIVLLAAMYVAIWPSVRGQPSMADFLNQMPEAFRSLFATAGADFTTPVGYVQIELMSFVAPITILLYAIGRGAGAIAGEEDSHTLELLLSAPVGRSRIVLEKFAALVVGTALLAAVTGLSLTLEGNLADMGLPAGNVAAAMVHLALLGLVFGTLALALSAATGHSGFSRGIPAALAVAAYALNGLAPVVDWLKPAQQYSPFYQYVGHDPLRNGLDGPSISIAAVSTLALLALAVLGFRRRDTAP
jgi:ABC-2 type transport system permease protein